MGNVVPFRASKKYVRQCTIRSAEEAACISYSYLAWEWVRRGKVNNCVGSRTLDFRSCTKPTVSCKRSIGHEDLLIQPETRYMRSGCSSRFPGPENSTSRRIQILLSSEPKRYIRDTWPAVSGDAIPSLVELLPRFEISLVVRKVPHHLRPRSRDRDSWKSS